MSHRSYTGYREEAERRTLEDPMPNGSRGQLLASGIHRCLLGRIRRSLIQAVAAAAAVPVPTALAGVDDCKAFAAPPKLALVSVRCPPLRLGLSPARGLLSLLVHLLGLLGSALTGELVVALLRLDAELERRPVVSASIQLVDDRLQLKEKVAEVALGALPERRPPAHVPLALEPVGAQFVPGLHVGSLGPL